MVEDAFDCAIPVEGREHLVPTIGHFERLARMLFRYVYICTPLLRMPTESSWSRPDVHDAFFKLCEHALFLELPKRGMWFCSRSEGAICRLGWGTGVDRRLGGYQVVWRYGDGRLRGCEEKPQLVRDEITGQGGARDSFFQNEAVVDGCDGDGGSTQIDDEGCGFARSEAITF